MSVTKWIEIDIFCLSSVEMNEKGFICFLNFVIRRIISFESVNIFFKGSVTSYRLQIQLFFKYVCTVFVTPINRMREDDVAFHPVVTT